MSNKMQNLSFEQMQSSYFSLLKKIYTIPKNCLDESFIYLRKEFIYIVSNICSFYQISDESLFRSVTIFEVYYSKTSNKEEIKENIEFITLVCLSLSTKQIENRCNYVSFFVDVILPTWFQKSYSKNKS